MVPDRVMAVDPPGPALGRAVEHLVLTLRKGAHLCAAGGTFLNTHSKGLWSLSVPRWAAQDARKRGRLKLATLPKRGAPRRENNADVAQLLHL
jgi:hypothetical protein